MAEDLDVLWSLLGSSLKWWELEVAAVTRSKEAKPDVYVLD